MINEIKRLAKIQHYNSDISIQFISRFIPSVHHFYENIIIDSNTLVAIGVSDIDLVYFSINMGGFIFGNGITFAIFLSLGPS